MNVTVHTFSTQLVPKTTVWQLHTICVSVRPVSSVSHLLCSNSKLQFSACSCPAAIISLSRNKHFAFVMAIGRVFCDSIIGLYLEYSRLQKGRPVIQAINGQPLTAVAMFRARAIPCGICGGQSGIGTGFFFFTVLRISPALVI